MPLHMQTVLKGVIIMYQYANSLSCTCTKDKNNFFLNFEQIGPLFDDDGDIKGSQTNTIASILIDADCAATLVAGLSHLLEEDAEDDETDE